MTLDTPAAAGSPVPTAAASFLPHGLLAAISAMTGAALLAGSYIGHAGLLVAAAVVQTALVFSWVLGTALPGRIGAIILGVLAAAGADAAVSRWHDSGFGPVLGLLGLAVPAMFIHQLTRGVVRIRVLESMSDITVLLVAVVSVAGLLLLRRQGDGETTTPAVIAAITAALTAAHLTDSLLARPRFDPTVERGVAGVVAGVVVAAAVGVLWLRSVIGFTGARSAFVAATIGGLSCLISVGVSFAGSHAGFDAGGRRPAVPRLRPIASVLLTVGLGAPLGYVLISWLSV